MKIVPESAGHAKRMYALHSHFMTEWKPAGMVASWTDFLPCPFPGHGLPVDCAMQHICNASNAKFCVTICPGLV
jgi:hypothetical protein